MGGKISVLGLIMFFSPISEICDGTVSLVKRKCMSTFVIWYINACVYHIVFPVI